VGDDRLSVWRLSGVSFRKPLCKLAANAVSSHRCKEIFFRGALSQFQALEVCDWRGWWSHGGTACGDTGSARLIDKITAHSRGILVGSFCLSDLRLPSCYLCSKRRWPRHRTYVRDPREMKPLAKERGEPLRWSWRAGSMRETPTQRGTIVAARKAQEAFILFASQTAYVLLITTEGCGDIIFELSSTIAPCRRSLRRSPHRLSCRHVVVWTVLPRVFSAPRAPSR
jgi:hypothetical protein